MKKQFENDDTMEPISYSVATGKTEWGKTLDSREITIEEYLKRIDPDGIVWKDDGSLPLFDFSQEKIIEHIITIKTFKKANDYLNKLVIIFNFILKKNNDSIPRCLNFGTLETIIEQNTVIQNRRFVERKPLPGFEKLKDHTMDKAYSFIYWQNVIGYAENTIRDWALRGLGPRDNKICLEHTGKANHYKTTRKNIETFFNKTNREIIE